MTQQVYDYFLEALDEWTRECVKIYEDPTISFDQYQVLKKILLERKLEARDIMLS